MKTMGKRIRQRRKGQSLVEFALSGILIAMLLAAAVDIGRVYYTYIVVLNMAGEGAAVLTNNSDADYFETVPPAPLDHNQTYQYRAVDVAARVLGRIIDSGHDVVIANNDVQVTDPNGGPMIPANRCPGVPFRVNVHYHIHDLFFPALLGFSQLTISASAESTFQVTGGGGTNCPQP